MEEAHVLALRLPGLGNPLDLTCAEFEAHLALLVKSAEIAQ